MSENKEVVTQCYKCKKVYESEKGLWTLKNGKKEHISFANHTLCPICQSLAQHEISFSSLFKEYSGHIKNIFPEFKLLFFSDDIQLKNEMIKKFSDVKLKVELYQKKSIYLHMSKIDTYENIIMYDINSETELNEFFDIYSTNNIKNLIFIVDEDLLKPVLKYTTGFTINYIFKGFLYEELICIVFKILTVNKQLLVNREEINSLKKNKLELLGQLMVLQESQEMGTPPITEETDELKQENEKLKQNLNTLNMELMNNSELLDNSIKYDKDTEFYSYNYLNEIIRLINNEVLINKKKAIVFKIKIFINNLEPERDRKYLINNFEIYQNYLLEFTGGLKEKISEDENIIRISFNELLLVFKDEPQTQNKLMELEQYCSEKIKDNKKIEIEKINITDKEKIKTFFIELLN